MSVRGPQSESRAGVSPSFVLQPTVVSVILRQRDVGGGRGGELSPRHYPRPANDRFSETDVKVTHDYHGQVITTKMNVC